MYQPTDYDEEPQYMITKGAVTHDGATNITTTSYATKSHTFTLADPTDTIEIKIASSGVSDGIIRNARVKSANYVELIVITD